jgi:hypothetical protein
VGERPDPLVEERRLPDQLHQAAAGAQDAGDVTERGDRVTEEHGSDAADRHVERLGGEGMHLGVGLRLHCKTHGH